ncbi:hypothetical protein J4457_01800 [Candidatus Woesearchaeota archaeon]|nr:hypothetical protein [Candidatus Woesearchaeota archaeon]
MVSEVNYRGIVRCVRHVLNPTCHGNNTPTYRVTVARFSGRGELGDSGRHPIIDALHRESTYCCTTTANGGLVEAAGLVLPTHETDEITTILRYLHEEYSCNFGCITANGRVELKDKGGAEFLTLATLVGYALAQQAQHQRFSLLDAMGYIVGATRNIRRCMQREAMSNSPLAEHWERAGKAFLAHGIVFQSFAQQGSCYDPKQTTPEEIVRMNLALEVESSIRNITNQLGLHLLETKLDLESPKTPEQRASEMHNFVHSKPEEG